MRNEKNIREYIYSNTRKNSLPFKEYCYSKPLKILNYRSFAQSVELLGVEGG